MVGIHSLDLKVEREFFKKKMFIRLRQPTVKLSDWNHLSFIYTRSGSLCTLDLEALA